MGVCTSPAALLDGDVGLFRAGETALRGRDDDTPGEFGRERGWLLGGELAADCENVDAGGKGDTIRVWEVTPRVGGEPAVT